jgi:DNA-directed RNA polymerase subunit M/transcription elongation factor TFIIS
MAQRVKIDLKKTIYAVYEKTGMIEACDWAINYNKHSVDQVPFEWCEACDNNTPSIEHECCLCGQETKKSTPPKFYQAVLKPIKDVMKHVYPMSKMTLAERMGDDNATCPECGDNKWMLLANESVAVREGGKAYCECLSCGYQTHL